jgi:hypothetical protein
VALQFYRYVGSQVEADQIVNARQIQTISPLGTWWTTDRFDTALEAQQALGLMNTPLYRVGPVDAIQMPPFDVVPLRPVAPAFNMPGGGIEGCTSGAVLLFGLYEYAAGSYRL